jgi:hypothetical protein
MSTVAVTKQQAAEQLIDGAIRAFEAGDHACAITLAGAAEGAMPPSDTRHFFEIARDAFVGQPIPGKRKAVEKEVVAELNAERDWLKHYNEKQPVEMELSNAILWIIRAVSKFHAVYGREAETSAVKDFFAVARTFDPED